MNPKWFRNRDLRFTLSEQLYQLREAAPRLDWRWGSPREAALRLDRRDDVSTQGSALSFLSIGGSSTHQANSTDF
jgi:hypothetical protein